MDNADITQPFQLKQWKYLDHITNQLNLEDNLPAGLLIRANCVKALEPLEILQSRSEGPYALKTRLGWCRVGPVSQNNKNTVSSNRIAARQADTKQVGTHFFQVENKVHDNEVPNMLKKSITTTSQNLITWQIKRWLGHRKKIKAFFRFWRKVQSLSMVTTKSLCHSEE